MRIIQKTKDDNSKQIWDNKQIKTCNLVEIVIKLVQKILFFSRRWFRYRDIKVVQIQEEKDNYMRKQQELIDVLTDEVQELYRSQEATEKKLDGILASLNDDPEKVKEISNHLNSCPRKDELEALSVSIKSWTKKLIMLLQMN